MATTEIRMEKTESLVRDVDLKQKKRIRTLYGYSYKQLTEEIKKMDLKTTKSSVLEKQELIELRKKIHKAQKEISEEINQMILKEQGKVIDSVVDEEKKKLKKFGVYLDGAFNHVKKDVVESIAAGKVYQGDWTLSRAIWGDLKHKQKDMNEIISRGVLENKTTYEIAKQLEMYVDPAAVKPWDWGKVYPGSSKIIDYNAQRLARTMISHGYEQSVILTNQKNPFTKGIRWLASNSHRTCQICKDRASQDRYGLGAGVYPPDKIPLDHPNGLCVFAVVQDDLEDIADRLSKWAYGADDKGINTWLADVYPDKYKQFFPVKNFVLRDFEKNNVSYSQTDIDGLLQKAKSYGKDLETMTGEELQNEINFCLGWYKNDGSCAKELFYWLKIKGVQFEDDGKIINYGKAVGEIKKNVAQKIKKDVKDGKIKPEKVKVFESVAEEYLQSLKNNRTNFPESELLEGAEKLFDKMKPEQARAIVEYTSNYYYEMNGFLRSGEKKKKTERVVETCINAFNGLETCEYEKDIVVRRGSSFGSLKGLLNTVDGLDITDEKFSDMSYKKDFSEIPKGIIVKDEGFMSTTPYSGGGFSGDVNYIIKAPAGTKMLYVAGRSNFSSEQEMLLNAGTSFSVEEIKAEYGTVNVFLKVVYQKRPENI